MSRSWRKNIGGMVTAVFLLLHIACGSTTTSGTDTVAANAGADADVLVGATATLDGLSSTGATTVAWTFTSVPDGSSATITSSDALSASFEADVVGEYVARLSINGGDSTDTVTITAKALVAEITVPSGSAITTRERFGATEYTINAEGTDATLSAEDSMAGSSALASNLVSGATYLWEQIAGPSATATSGTDGSTFTFTAPSLAAIQDARDSYQWGLLPISRDDSTMKFKVTITDASGNSDVAIFDVYLTDNGAELHPTSGLKVVGTGTKVYLSGPSLLATSSASTDITDWSWTLAVPTGSSATFTDSGTTSSTIQIPSFVADVSGTYTVSYTSTSGSVATANTISVVATTYAGLGTVGGTTAVAPQCANCHDGSVESDKVTNYLGTAHATVFEDAIDSYTSLSPEPYLWQYHTVGYNTDADSSGFDDLASDESFTFPDSGITFADFTTDYPSVAKLANVQCESCHGPGGAHNGNPTKIDMSVSITGVCGQCHTQEVAWENSSHNSTGIVHGSGRYQSSWIGSSCNRCHTGLGFQEHARGIRDGEDALTVIEEQSAITSSSETGAFVGIQCVACHNPHSATNPYQMRLYGEVTMVIDDTVVDAGVAAVCYTCHDGSYSYGHTSCDDNNDGTAEAMCLTADQIAVGYYRQMHYNPQAPVLEGKGGLTDLDGDGTDDFTLDENSFHTQDEFILADVTGDVTQSATNDKCVTCHMASGPSSEEEGYKHVGGHSFKMRSGHSIGHLTADAEDGTEEETAGDIEHVSACQGCHLDVDDTFDREARADYDGDGVTEGIQTEVKGLLVALTAKIIAQDGGDVITETSGSVYSDSEYTIDALSYTSTSSATKGWRIATDTIRRAVWNHNMIVRDGSMGIHNSAYTIQLLQGTYTAVGGNAFEDDYPDATIR